MKTAGNYITMHAQAASIFCEVLAQARRDWDARGMQLSLDLAAAEKQDDGSSVLEIEEIYIDAHASHAQFLGDIEAAHAHFSSAVEDLQRQASGS